MIIPEYTNECDLTIDYRRVQCVPLYNLNLHVELFYKGVSKGVYYSPEWNGMPILPILRNSGSKTCFRQLPTLEYHCSDGMKMCCRQFSGVSISA